MSLARHLRGLALGASLLAGAACGSTYAESAGGSGGAGGHALVAEPTARSPYEVTIVREDGGTVDTFAHRGRYYVLGTAGERYTIRVTNPTDARVEAVVTVDGLDVIDGEAGDLGKRGYIVPARGDLRIEGFRTTAEQVATFRFSSVDGSYAARKGAPRNVGVIAVAVFAEQAAPELIVDEPAAPRKADRYEWERDLDDRWSGATGRGPSGETAGRGDEAAGQRDEVPMEAPRAKSVDGDMPSAGAVAEPSMTRRPMPDSIAPPVPPPCCDQPPPATTARPGLGTEFGERRYSATRQTRFVRASDKPVAVAELRYNDAPGLMALGIAVTPGPDAGELSTRETADPFPGDRRYAAPPR